MVAASERLKDPTLIYRREAVGLANLAASIATFGCTSLNSKTDRPLSQLTVQRNGIFTPATSR